ncbi:hypothetical protein H633G_11538 [Metarhizium anisopliae BRIP 53284]|nr:hypothetical protein H633G_11538 [Metarhizium anisopliae BRIP 53284]
MYSREIHSKLRHSGYQHPWVTYTSSGPTTSNGHHRNDRDSRRFQFERLRSNQDLKYLLESMQGRTDVSARDRLDDPQNFLCRRF